MGIFSHELTEEEKFKMQKEIAQLKRKKEAIHKRQELVNQKSSLKREIRGLRTQRYSGLLGNPKKIVEGISNAGHSVTHGSSKKSSSGIGLGGMGGGLLGGLSDSRTGSGLSFGSGGKHNLSFSREPERRVHRHKRRHSSSRSSGKTIIIKT